jgi:LysR family transcriptional regulator for metE and metH
MNDSNINIRKTYDQVIEIRDLNLIRMVTECGSLTVTARRLHLSQPAVSQRLSKLQQYIGETLFERRDGRMRATGIAKRLAEAARRIDLEYQAALTDIDSLINDRQARLRITTQCYTCYRWLPYVIRDLRKLHPSLTVDVIPDATDSPYKALSADQVDVAIVFNSTPHDDFEEQDLFGDELFAVMHSKHRFAKRKFLNPAQFADETLVLYTGDRHPIVDDILDPAGISPGRITEVRITEAIVELVRAGEGIAVLAGWAFSDLDDSSDLVAVRITRGGFRRTWRAAINHRCSREYVDSLLKCVREIGHKIQHDAWREELRQVAPR